MRDEDIMQEGFITAFEELEQYQGGGTFWFREIVISVTAENLKGKLSGSGKMELKGAVENTSLQLSGWGIITASALESQEAKVKISGSGRIEVYAQVMLSIQISGSGTVKYKSDKEKPRVFSNLNGSGRVTQGI